ncbi:hypothetical protein [Teichococcus vastitatis]|uniref:Uncharacterized protein n=1 Tax=Teichococcus vastitatis TaxID=2307076 RepID=A0ABS9W2X1_9PROT|nr:hypothetical protein [Pseudoroseomonas vastitatis]MCI0753557.1 hypothetical protein [Pseudoroseomonas vastitatis]
MFGIPPKPDPFLAARFEKQQARYDAAVQRRQEAWQALEPGFRKRVASGEVVLEGLQCAPVLATARSVIPALWARLLIFNTAGNEISTTVQNLKFMDVTAYHTGQRIRADAGAAALPDDLSAAATIPAPRPRGRESYEPLIEAALDANWDKVQERAARHPEQRPVWSEAAKILHNWLRKEHRDDGQKIPHFDTIRTRLSQIYARRLSEKPVRK